MIYSGDLSLEFLKQNLKINDIVENIKTIDAKELEIHLQSKNSTVFFSWYRYENSRCTICVAGIIPVEITNVS